MSANAFRFQESWEIPNASVDDVYEVLSRGELLPLWWKGVYLEAERPRRVRNAESRRAHPRESPRLPALSPVLYH